MTPRVLFAACVPGLLSPAVRGVQPPGSPAGPPKELVVYPKQVKLTGPRDEQRLIVLGVWPDGRKWDLTRSATITSAGAKVAAVEKGVVRPVAGGARVRPVHLQCLVQRVAEVVE